jgi:hypothetical protein
VILNPFCEAILDIVLRALEQSKDSIMRRLVKVGPGWSTMPGGGMSMLLQLILLPGTIASCSPDALSGALTNRIPRSRGGGLS